MNKVLYKITKIKSADNPVNENSTFGESAPYHVGLFIEKPIIGKRFNLQGISGKNGYRGISTTAVTVIIDDNTFATLNSVYKYELL